jgi:hypothetical protein
MVRKRCFLRSFVRLRAPWWSKFFDLTLFFQRYNLYALALEPVDESPLLGQNRNMLENRKSLRYRTLAQAYIPGILEGDNLLKDLSITGCCVECTAYADIQLNSQYQLEVEPENAANIGNFVLSVESKWVRTGDYSSEVGFIITASPKGKLFQRYVDYLAYRAALT